MVPRGVLASLAMNLRDQHLAKHPSVFQALTGLTLPEFDSLGEQFLPLFTQADRQRRQRPDRRRAPAGGPHFALTARDQFLLVLVWLRHYPTRPTKWSAICSASATR